MNAHDLLKIVREQTGRLLETAPSIPEHVVKDFQNRFLTKYPNIAIPDVANGLRSIKLAPVAPCSKSSTVLPPSMSCFEEDKRTISVIVDQLPPSPIPEGASKN